MCRCSPSGLRLSTESCSVRAISNRVWINIASFTVPDVLVKTLIISLHISTRRGPLNTSRIYIVRNFELKRGGDGSSMSTNLQQVVGSQQIRTSISRVTEKCRNQAFEMAGHILINLISAIVELGCQVSQQDLNLAVLQLSNNKW